MKAAQIHILAAPHRCYYPSTNTYFLGDTAGI
uniref:Uncharacterized protein n=1 Tax=Arundo donax TaxID=35708 RepID=A0A0A9ABB5_ARUDO